MFWGCRLSCGRCFPPTLQVRRYCCPLGSSCSFFPSASITVLCQKSLSQKRGCHTASLLGAGTICACTAAATALNGMTAQCRLTHCTSLGFSGAAIAALKTAPCVPFRKQFETPETFPLCCAGAAPFRDADDERGTGVALAVRGWEKEGLWHVVGRAKGVQPGWAAVAGHAPRAGTPRGSGKGQTPDNSDRGLIEKKRQDVVFHNWDMGRKPAGLAMPVKRQKDSALHLDTKPTTEGREA